MDLNNQHSNDLFGQSEVYHNEEAKKHRSYDNKEVVSVKIWIPVILLLLIPFINVIFLVMMISGNVNENVKNFCKAFSVLLFISLIITFLYFLF